MNEELLKPKITAREKEVIRASNEGLSSKMVARKLGISVNTVAAHKRNVMMKAGCTTWNQLLTTLFRLDIID